MRNVFREVGLGSIAFHNTISPGRPAVAFEIFKRKEFNFFPRRQAKRSRHKS